METIPISFNILMDNKTKIHIHSGILFSCKETGIVIISGKWMRKYYIEGGNTDPEHHIFSLICGV